MWTNIFRIGGLHQISWFQFFPNEFDFSTLPDKSAKVDQKDAAISAVLSAHLQLQKEGFLSAWTNSFVGPWDPSQGLHNPDEKIKLWLFLPGQHSSVVEKAQHAVARLRVLASGFWVSPGDSEEVASAISQALRNSIERALRRYSYVRFGDVFSKYQPFTQNEELFRRGQPVAEFIFAATEETIFVHVIISAKHVRALSNGDIEPFMSSSSKRTSGQISVVVSPHGMRGKLTGCCPGDLVKQVYLSSGKFRDQNGIVGLPSQVALGSGLPAQLKGQNCFVEVTLGCQDKMVRNNANLHSNFSQPHGTESPATRLCNQRWPLDKAPVCEKMFVYPTEAVLVPVMQTSFARSSLKRFWLQNWAGPSLSGSSLVMHCDDKVDSMDGSSLEPSGTRSRHGYRSSSNSNSSSYGSISSSSSDSDRKALGAGDLEADADSSMSKQSGLSSLGQMPNDGLQLGSKRPRSGTSESFGQAGMVLNPSMTEYGTMEANMSMNGATNEQIGSRWGWDDDDRGMGMDIQALLSEFGDFGDFFENDALPFGEPPGTAESQAIIFPAPDGGELCSSPSNSVMDVSDRMIVSPGFPSFDNFNHVQAPDAVEDILSKNQETTNSSAPSQVTYMLPSSNGEFDHVVKAEALMTFAPEYGGVEAPKSEISSVIFRSPYVPRSCKVDSASSSNQYVYSATPPSPFYDGSHEKSTLPASEKAYAEKKDYGSALKLKKYYTHVERGTQKIGGSNNSLGKGEVRGASAQFSASSQADAKPVSTKTSDGLQREDNSLPSSRTVLATEIECLVSQVSMCRLRHTLLSSSNLTPSGLSGLSSSSSPNLGHVDSSIMTDNISSKSELKKKETIPVRIAGDVDGGMLDGSLTAPVGVWRSVGLPKLAKTSTSSMEVCPSIPHNSFMEEGMLSYGLRQPLQELLDGIAFLVQQATSFVDVALDADCGDGPYGWLALQEQWRRGFSCGPSMVHAGCGGLLASSHSLDIAGMELVDPLSVDVQASSTIGLLQSDIKAALKSAFSSAEGPLSVTDWCRGRNPSNESSITSDGHSSESIACPSESRDSSSTVISVGDPMSPSLTSAGGASGLKADGTRGDDGSSSVMESDQQQCSRIRPTLSVVPFPSILVGYQDDWLKTSASSLQLWEKAPLEPYATAKHMSYYVVCPNIDPLTTAATDFFLQLGTVYETCKLGTHAPQSLGNEMDIDSGKISPGFVLLDCPQSMKIDTNNASMLGSISDYFLFLSNGWDLTSYLKTLSKVLKTLKFGSSVTVNAKEGNGGPCTVVYVVCPFPEPLAVLQTVVEASIAIGSVIRSSDKERRSMMHNQVAKALSYPASVDESFSNVLTLTGFSIPKLVLQIVTVDAIFRVTSPTLNELIILKEIAFTVYNKARRISRGPSGETMSSLSVPGGSHSVLMQMSSTVPGMWKDCVGSRIGGPTLQRDSELDTRGAWDNSWQTARSGGLGADPSRTGDIFLLDEIRCLFEPLFILAEPGSIERGVSPFSGNSADPSKLSDDCASTSFLQNSASSGTGDNGPGPVPQHDSLDSDGLASGHQKSLPSLHCCYGWTEDWRWMVCIWTDSRGELLDSCVYPFGGISSRQDTKGLQSLFVQILQQGCQILQACSPDVGAAKPRDLVITRIGCFFELECQEWQKALYSAGGSEVKKWSLQLRRSFPDGMAAGSNGNSLQQQEMSLMQERAHPSSPSPSLYSSHSKSSAYMKGGIVQPSSRKQLMGGHTGMDNSKGLLQWIQSISFVSVSIDHSLQLFLQADSSPGSSQGSTTSGLSTYLEGYTPVKSLGSTSASYILAPSPSMRFLPPSVLQLPTCLTADSPPLAHLLHSKGSAIPLSTGFVVSKAVPSMRRDSRSQSKEEWPSVLSVSLVDYYGGNNFSQNKLAKGGNKRGVSSEAKDTEVEAHIILDTIAAELHALSWMTASPAYLERRSALPFHCDMVLRLRRLLHFADKEHSRLPEKSRG